MMQIFIANISEVLSCMRDQERETTYKLVVRYLTERGNIWKADRVHYKEID